MPITPGEAVTCDSCGQPEEIDHVMNCESCGVIVCTECIQPDTEDIPLCPDCHDNMLSGYAWDRRPGNASFY